MPRSDKCQLNLPRWFPDWLRHPRGGLAVAFRFLRLVVTRFVEDQGLPNAAALTYTTLLSLVPLMAVSLSIFSAFPISERVEQEVENFLFQNFVPSSSEVLQRYFSEFSHQASRISGPGFLALLVVALLLMENIDRAINRIWRTPHQRRPLSKLKEYWAVLTLTPIMIGSSVAVSTWLGSLTALTDAAASLNEVSKMLQLAPLFASVLGFTILYAVVPNRRVPFIHALASGFFAGLMFEVAKRGFAFYLTTFPSYEAIYGTLAAVPVFLIWVYLSWTITLLGAEVSCCLGLYHDHSCAGAGRRENEFLLVYRVLRLLREGQREGTPRSTRALSEALHGCPEETLEQVLLPLMEARLVLRIEGGLWALGRDLTQVRLYDLYRIRPFVLPRGDPLRGTVHPAEQTLIAVLARIEEDLEREMSGSLEALFDLQAASEAQVDVGGDQPLHRE